MSDKEKAAMAIILLLAKNKIQTQELFMLKIYIKEDKKRKRKDKKTILRISY
jgi:hypothetical protein